MARDCLRASGPTGMGALFIIASLNPETCNALTHVRHKVDGRTSPGNRYGSSVADGERKRQFAGQLTDRTRRLGTREQECTRSVPHFDPGIG